MCLNASIGENIICLMWWTCLFTTKRHGSTSPYLGWANIGCGHGNIESFNGKKICFNISNGRGLKFHPLQTTQKVITDPQITICEPFNMFLCPKN
jgi:hypothetical protein